MEKYKNGLELLITFQLGNELADDYRLKGKAKMYYNMLTKEIEKEVSNKYNEIYAKDPELVTNSIRFKHRLIQQIASLNEPDSMLLSEFTDKFIQNIELARKKGTILFDKLI